MKWVPSWTPSSSSRRSLSYYSHFWLSPIEQPCYRCSLRPSSFPSSYLASVCVRGMPLKSRLPTSRKTFLQGLHPATVEPCESIFYSPLSVNVFKIIQFILQCLPNHGPPNLLFRATLCAFEGLLDIGLRGPFMALNSAFLKHFQAMRPITPWAILWAGLENLRPLSVPAITKLTSCFTVILVISVSSCTKRAPPAHADEGVLSSRHVHITTRHICDKFEFIQFDKASRFGKIKLSMGSGRGVGMCPQLKGLVCRQWSHLYQTLDTPKTQRSRASQVNSGVGKVIHTRKLETQTHSVASDTIITKNSHTRGSRGIAKSTCGATHGPKLRAS